MVTHDVDEALFLSDRVAMMTNGPEARLGAVLSVPFPRPRNREAVMEDPDYYRLREQLIGFLEEHDIRRSRPRTDTVAVPRLDRTTSEPQVRGPVLAAAMVHPGPVETRQLRLPWDAVNAV